MWSEIKNFWYAWNNRLFILSIQFLLVLFASYRQRIKNIVLTTLLWLTYLTENWIAAYAIGIISNSQSDPSKGTKTILLSGSLLFCFILVVLVVLPLIPLKIMNYGTVIYFYLCDNKLWFPTFLVLLVGFGATTFRKLNPGYDYEEAVAKYSRTRPVKIVEQTEIAMVEKLSSSYEGRSLDDDSEKPDDMELLLTAYSLLG